MTSAGITSAPAALANMQQAGWNRALTDSEIQSMTRATVDSVVLLDSIGTNNANNYGDNAHVPGLWWGASSDDSYAVYDISDPENLAVDRSSSESDAGGIAISIDDDLLFVGAATMRVRRFSTNTLLANISTSGDDETPLYDSARNILYYRRASLSGISVYSINTSTGAGTSLDYLGLTGGDPQRLYLDANDNTRLIAIDFTRYVELVDTDDTSNIALFDSEDCGASANLEQAAFDWDAGVCWVVDTGTHEIHCLDISGTTVTLEDSFSHANLADISGAIAYDSVNKRIFVTDHTDKSIVWLDANSPFSLAYEDRIIPSGVGAALTSVVQAVFDEVHNVLFIHEASLSDTLSSWDVYGLY